MIQIQKWIYCSALLTIYLTPSLAEAFTLLYTSVIPVVGWQTTKISFDIDYTNCPSVTLVNSAVDTATDIWNSLPMSDLIVTRGTSITTSVAAATSSSHTAGNPMIVCDPNFSTTGGQAGLQDVSPGFATNTLTTASGKIIYSVIVLNVQAGAQANIANFDPELLSIILAHEIGHVLGLGHSADTNALMYYNASEKKRLSLAQDDMDGISFLYPRNELGSGSMFGCGSISRNLNSHTKNNTLSNPHSNTQQGVLMELAWLIIFGIIVMITKYDKIFTDTDSII